MNDFNDLNGINEIKKALSNIDRRGPVGTVATITRVAMFQDARGAQVEERQPVDGWTLPEGVPRFLAFGLAVAQTLGQSADQGVQIPFRFALEASDIVAAFDEYGARIQEESQKAYQHWVALQTGPRLALPGAKG